VLQGLMQASAAKDADPVRWAMRYADIARSVETAAKYAPEQLDDPMVAKPTASRYGVAARGREAGGLAPPEPHKLRAIEPVNFAVDGGFSRGRWA